MINYSFKISANGDNMYTYKDYLLEPDTRTNPEKIQAGGRRWEKTIEGGE